MAIAVASVLSLPILAQATNGMFAHGYGTKNRALAGSGIALPQDAMINATNPAGLVWVGNRMDIGAELFSPRREYKASPSATGLVNTNDDLDGGAVESENEYFLIPHFAMNWMVTDGSSIGFALYGNGGMNTEYDNDDTGFGAGVYGGDTAGIDYNQLFLDFSYSAKIGSSSSWGAGAIVAVQSINIKGLSQFAGTTETADFTQPPPDFGVNDLTNNGTDLSFGVGFKIGFHTEIVSGVSFALSYRSKIHMTDFDDYSDMLPNSGELDIPATATVGLAFQPSRDVALTFDVQHIWYDDVDAIGNEVQDFFNGCFGPRSIGLPSVPETCLGGSDGAGFGWDNMTIYKFGAQWRMNSEWTWRLGYSHGSQLIDDDQVALNVLAPATIEDHITFGFTKQMSKTTEINFAAMYAPSENVSGVVFGQEIELEMRQYSLEASWGMKF